MNYLSLVVRLEEGPVHMVPVRVSGKVAKSLTESHRRHLTPRLGINISNFRIRALLRKALLIGVPLTVAHRTRQ